MATPKSGNLIKLYLRENGSTAAYRYVVCNEALSLDGTSDTISRPTKCGTLQTAGTPSFEIPVSGVADTAPTVDQVSASELWAWFASGTELDFVWGDDSSAPSFFGYSGSGTFSALTLDAPVDDFVGFDGTFTVNGTPTDMI